MGASEQLWNETSDVNDASSVLSVILGGVISGCAVLTVLLIFLIWFKNDCLEPTRRGGESDDEEPLPECPKYSGSPGTDQDQAPPPYEAARSHSGSATERWGDDRTVYDEGDDHMHDPCQRFEDPRLPAASSPPLGSDTTCLNSKASSIRDTTAA